MAHFARLENNIVCETIVVANEDCGGGEFPASEPIGQAFIASLGLTGEWKQTSYNGNFRKQYAGIGCTYNPDADIFVLPQIYGSWNLDENFDWQPPTPMPTDGKMYGWFEPTQQWVEIVEP
jgi:hypothetical protein